VSSPLITSCVRLKDSLIDMPVHPRIVENTVVVFSDGLQVYLINLFIGLAMELEVCADKGVRNVQEAMVCIHDGDTSSLIYFHK
jgi:hypothetical protein